MYEIVAPTFPRAFPDWLFWRFTESGASSESVSTPLSHPATPEILSRQQRILIIEDNEDAARTLQELLQFDGYDVQVAYTGADGIDIARSFLPHVVLCDIGLPGMDGWQVASTLRGEAATTSTRFIAISGYGTEEARRRSEQAGFEAHMTKPLDLDALVRMLGGRP
jgi:CheY-like chemotaxis protein